MPDITVPRETSEFMELPLTDKDTGAAITDFQVQVTRWPARPAPGGWSAATVSGTKRGVVLAGLVRGTHTVWANVGGSVVAVGSVWVE